MMNISYTHFKKKVLLLLIVALAFLPQNSKASHLAGMQLTYVNVGQDSFLFTFSLLRDCGGISVTEQTWDLDIACGSYQTWITLERDTAYDASFEAGLCSSYEGCTRCSWVQNANPLCAGAPLIDGVEKITFTGLFVIPFGQQGCRDWVFASRPTCCRPSMVNSPISPDGSQDQATYSSFDLLATGGLNSSPIVNSSVVQYFCCGDTSVFSIDIEDTIDGDQLVYRLHAPIEGFGAGNANLRSGLIDYVTYAAGYSNSHPMDTMAGGAFKLDSINGVITFIPPCSASVPAGGTVQEGNFGVEVLEIQNGNIVASTLLDFQYIILNCQNGAPSYVNPSNITANGFDSTNINAGSFNICAGDTVKWELIVDDPDSLDILFLKESDITSKLPGVIIDTTYPNSPDSSVLKLSFEWQTDSTYRFNDKAFDITISDGACPQEAILNYRYTVEVTGVKLTASDTAICSGVLQTIQLGAVPQGGTGAGSFFWTSANPNPTAANYVNQIALGSANWNIQNPTVKLGGHPLTNPEQKIAVLYDDGICVARDTITISEANLDLLLISEDTLICPTSTSDVKVFTNVANANGTGTWKWSEYYTGNVLANTADSLITSIKDSVTILAEYDEGACHAEKLIKFTRLAEFDAVLASTSTDTSVICEGQNDQVVSTFTPAIPTIYPCNTTILSCKGNPREEQIGTPAATSTLNSPFRQTGNGTRYQMLYRSYELSNLDSLITAMQFDISSNNISDSLLDFTIKIACVDIQDFNNGGPFYENVQMHTVFQKNIKTTSGWNNFEFDNPYYWDGSSNLLIEICHTSIFGNAANAVRTMATPHRSVLRKDNQYACDDNTRTISSYNERPVVKFLTCKPDYTGSATYTWSSLNGGAISDSFILSPYLFPTQTDTFVIVADFLGCVYTDSLVLEVNAKPDINPFADTAICKGMPLDFNIAGSSISNSKVEWTTEDKPATIFSTAMSQTIYPTETTTYYAKVFNICGYDIDTFTVTVSEDVTIVTQVTDVDCHGQSTGAISTNVSGSAPPFTYDWDIIPDQANHSNLVAGIYNLTVTDAQGCQDYEKVEIFGATEILAIAEGTQLNCNGESDGEITLRVNGGTAPYRYLWNNSETTKDLNGLSSGIYSVTVTDAKGCQEVAATTIAEPEQITYSVQVGTADCRNQTADILIVANGGVSNLKYTWNDPSLQGNNPQDVPVGTYFVVISDENNCFVQASVEVKTPEDLEVTLSANTDYIDCFGAKDGELTATVSNGSGNYKYVWAAPAGNSPVASNLTAGTYTVLVIDNVTGCQGTAEYTITQPTQDIVITPSVTTNCGYATISLEVNGGTPYPSGREPYDLIWNKGLGTSFNPSNVPSGTYIVTVTDSKGCKKSQPVVVDAGILPEFFVEIEDPIQCYGGTGQVSVSVVNSGGARPYTFYWPNGAVETDNGQSVQKLSAGSHVVRMVDAEGCEFFVPVFELTQPDKLVVSHDHNDQNCLGQADGSLILIPTGGSKPYNFSGTFGNESGTVFKRDNLEPGTYIVEVVDDNGCGPISTTIVIDPSTTDCSISAKIPNIFTPNGDNLNDYFQIDTDGEIEIFKVFNRWGELIYDNPQEAKWDGYFNGSLQSADTYIYYIQVKDGLGRVTPYEGEFLLSR